VIGFALFRALRLYMQANAVQGGLPAFGGRRAGPENLPVWRLFVMFALVAAQ
jgi:hypothetical protein